MVGAVAGNKTTKTCVSTYLTSSLHSPFVSHLESVNHKQYRQISP